MKVLLEVLFTVLLDASAPSDGKPMPLWGKILRGVIAVIWLGLLILIGICTFDYARQGETSPAIRLGIIFALMLGIALVYLTGQWKHLQNRKE